MPVAVNVWAVPKAIVDDRGVIAIEIKAGGFTVNIAEALTDAISKPIVESPGLRAVACPVVPGELLMVAIAAALELQWPEAVKSCVVPSL